VSSNSTRRVLVVANRTSGTPVLLDEVRRRARTGPHHFTLLVPDAPDAKTADWTLDAALPLLTRAATTQVEGLSGGPDPLAAIREAVEHGSFDEIIISTLSKRTSRWLRRDLPRRVQELGLPVTVISADKDFLPPSFLPEGIANAAGGGGG
jgi:hypothetical protein